MGLVLLLSVPMISIGLDLFSGGAWPKTLSLYIWNTLGLMIGVGLLATLIGVSCAWFISAYDFPGRKILSWALILPIAAPAYIIAYVYADLLEYFGPVQSTLRGLFGWGQGDYVFPSIRNPMGAIFTLSFVLYPYVYLLARASFLNQSRSQWQAARNLGLTARQAFFRIALPSARPAIAGGAALVLMETLADFGVADFFAVPTFSVGIFRNWLILGDRPAAMKLAAVMLLAVILLVILESSTRRGSTASLGKTRAQSDRISLKGWRAVLITSLCGLPVLLGLIIPVARLIYHSVSGGDNMAASQLFGFTINSLILGVVVGLIALTLALYLSFSKRANPSKTRSTFIRIGTLGYALPGALLAVGLLTPLALFDQSLTRFAKSALGWGGGLILTGTIIALAYALVIRFLTVAFNSVDANLEQISPSLENVSRSLGAGYWRRTRQILLPLLRPGLISAFILVFIDVMRELPATLIMRPFNFDTLATRIYWLASDERLAEASTAALLIIGVSIIPTLYLNAFMSKKER